FDEGPPRQSHAAIRFRSAPSSIPTRLAKRTNTVGQKRRERAQLGPASVFAMMDRVFGDDLHAKTVLSLAMGVVGVLYAASLGIHAIGRGMAAAAALNSKHATKQLDRLLNNGKVHIWRLFQPWIEFVIGPRKELVVAMDWTEFDADDQATI